MGFLFEITKHHFKIFSAVCSNLVVVWLIAALAAKDLTISIRDLILVVAFWYLAVEAEKISEDHE